VESGKRKVARLKAGMTRIIESASSSRVDYIAFIDKDTFEPLSTIRDGKTLIALAVFIGKTRLIDNAVV
jgi:pantoate--beta-alanine ligase